MAKDNKRLSRYRTAFGAALSEQLAKKRMNQADLSKAVDRSTAYTNQVMTGRKRASPEWVDLIAETLKLSPEERQRMHHAAATDAGYKLDLTPKAKTRG